MQRSKPHRINTSKLAPLLKFTILRSQGVKTVVSPWNQVFLRHPYLYTILFCSLYLLLFQQPFISTGDTWAEAYYEYVHGAIANGWQGFFHAGIAGYFNFLPKLISYPYIQFGLPVDKIDHFFRICTILYAVVSVAYIAHRHNRYLIRNDWLRSGLALLTLMSL